MLGRLALGTSFFSWYASLCSDTHAFIRVSDLDFVTQTVMMLTGTALFVNVDRRRARLASGYEEIGTKDY
jgi:hypothetical protein